MSYRLRCVFVPQVWENDYARTVTVERQTVWEADYDEIPEQHSDASDELRHHPDTPGWTKDWPGPFEVEFQVRFTVVGIYQDELETLPSGVIEFQRYASYFWADDAAHAEEQARLEAGDSLIVAGVLAGEALVTA